MRYSRVKPGKEDVNRIFAPKEGDINFKLADLQFENYAHWVWSQINPNKKFIVIGLDQGAHFAKYFVNKYSANCVAFFSLGDRILTKENYEKTFHSDSTYNFIKSIVGDDWNKYVIENINDQTISDLLKKISNEKDNEGYINLLNGICKGIIRSQYDKIDRMYAKTIIYSDIKTATEEKIALNENFANKSKGNVIYNYTDDNSYYLIYGRYRESIIAHIAGFIWIH